MKLKNYILRPNLSTLVGLILCLGLFLHSANSQTRKAGLTGAAFLKVGVEFARAVGLGSATSAITGDVNQIFWNPAGIALTEADANAQATFSYKSSK